MPGNGSGIYRPPAGTAAASNTTIESAVHNAVMSGLIVGVTKWKLILRVFE